MDRKMSHVKVLEFAFLTCLFFNSATVSQIQMSISSSEVVLTTSSPPDITFMCTISSIISVTTIYTMQIVSKGETGKDSSILAEVQNTNPTSPTLAGNVPQGSSVSGGIDTNTPTSSTLTLTRPTADIQCSDKGYYECKLIYQDASSNVISLNNNQPLSIYVLPSDPSLSARRNGRLIQGTITDQADVDVGDIVQFTCTANIGSNNSTRIRWKRTGEIGTVDHFLMYNPPQDSYDDGTPSSGPTNCTYSRTAIMSYTVTSSDVNRDNNLAFQCYISVVPPGQNEYETQNPPSFYINVAQVQMSISPSEVVLTRSSPPDTTFLCTISPSINVTTIYNMQIISKGETGTESVVMAQVVGSSPTVTDNAPQGSSVSGGINTHTPTSSTLIFTRPTADIVCSDKGYYECKLVYQDPNNNVVVSEKSQTLSVYVLPSDPSLSARRNGELIQGTITNEADVNVGDIVQFTCTANIGSNNSTRIRWKRTSDMRTVDYFILYDPPQGTYDDGTPSSGNSDCTYTRTATMTYKVTSFDAKRDNNLAFQCYISVVPPGQNKYETQNPPSFYINPVTAAHVQMSISPPQVVLTTSSPPDTTFMCTISSSINVTTIYNMQIISKGETGTASLVLAEIQITNPTSPILKDNAAQGSSVSGGIDTNTPTSSTLTLTRPTADIVCRDRGYYECKLTYQDPSSNVITSKNNRRLSIYVLPGDPILSVRKNGQLIQGTITNEADVAVGDLVEFTCTANIGSNSSTRIRWKRASKIGTIYSFISYNPTLGTYDDGIPSSRPTDCTYSRTATMSYNVTSFDASRDNNLAFQCYISVVPSGHNKYETQNPPAFYISVGSADLIDIIG